MKVRRWDGFEGGNGAEGGSQNLEVGKLDYGKSITEEELSETPSSISELIDTANQAAQSTAEAHQKFLELSNEITRSYAETFDLQTRLLQHALAESDESLLKSDLETPGSEIASKTGQTPESEVPNSDFPFPTLSRLSSSTVRIPTSQFLTLPHFRLPNRFFHARRALSLPWDPSPGFWDRNLRRWTVIKPG